MHAAKPDKDELRVRLHRAPVKYIERVWITEAPVLNKSGDLTLMIISCDGFLRRTRRRSLKALRNRYYYTHLDGQEISP